MKTSSSGRALIEQREGRKLAAYYDSKGILTIGVGHTGRMSPPAVTAGMTITPAQCDAMLAADLAPVEAAINLSVKASMTQNEFDALASLGFNIGVAGLKASTVVKRLNLGDIAGAADAFLLWNHPPVLASRRRAERAQFLGLDAMPGRSRPPITVTDRRAPLAEAQKGKVAHSKAVSSKPVQSMAGRSSAVVLATAGAVTAVTTHAHHPWIAIVGGGLVMAAVACAVIVVRLGARTAPTSAVHAEEQPHIAAASDDDRTKTIPSLK